MLKPELIGAGLLLGARVIRGEFSLSPDNSNRLSHATDVAEDLMDAVEGFDPDNPFTWLRTSLKLTYFLIHEDEDE